MDYRGDESRAPPPQQEAERARTPPPMPLIGFAPVSVRVQEPQTGFGYTLPYVRHISRKDVPADPLHDARRSRDLGRADSADRPDRSPETGGVYSFRGVYYTEALPPSLPLF